MSFIRSLSFLSAGIFILLSLCSDSGHAATSPFLPDTGDAARRQRALDLQHPNVVLAIAWEPGYEDPQTLAYLRFGLGARVVCVYITNGETTPSDLNDEDPFKLAARRKEEAYRSMKYLGCEPYFLNVPDRGAMRDERSLRAVWQADSVGERIERAILIHRPDLILVQTGFEHETRKRQEQLLLMPVVEKAALSARNISDVQAASGMPPWTVQKLLARSKGTGGFRMPAGARNDIWNITYRSMGEAAAGGYNSLRWKMAWRKKEWGALYAAYGFSKGKSLPLLPPLPIRTNLKRLESGVQNAARMAEKDTSSRTLHEVSQAIEAVDYLLGPQVSSLNNGEKRVVGAWKSGLEDLRCSLLNLHVTIEAPDSLLTRSQLFFLKYKGIAGKITSGKTMILFPAVTSQGWAVDESDKPQYELTGPRDFRVLSPANIPYNAPVSLYGLNLQRIRTPFIFVVFHVDSIRDRNFVYRKEIEFGIGPRRSFEISPSVARAIDGEHVVYTIENYTRDLAASNAHIDDSLMLAARRDFRVPSKDFELIDTLVLQMRRSVTPGDYPVDVQIFEKPLGHFTARAFAADADTTRTVGVISGRDVSPIESALRRLRVPWVRVDSAMLSGSIPQSLSTIVIDEDADLLPLRMTKAFPDLLDWARAGGHLIILPPYAGTLWKDAAVTFGQIPGLPASAAVSVDTTDQVLRSPNRLTSEDWNEWVVSRAVNSLHMRAGAGFSFPVRSAATREPLVASKKEGKGKITYVALNIMPQLMDILPGAYRLLANLVAAQ